MYKKISELTPVSGLLGGDLLLVARGENSFSFDAGILATVDGTGKLSGSLKPVYSYAEITGTPAPLSKLSDLFNDAGFVTSSGARAAISVVGSLTYNPASGVITAPTLASVATSGAYADLTGAPVLAAVATSGAYADLVNKPALAPVATSGSYADLTAKPVLSTVATSGSYADLSGKPNAFAYNTGNTVVTGDLIPAQDITYNLGSPTKRWHSVYIGANTIYLGNSSTLGGTYISVEADPNSTSLAQMPTMTASRLVAKPYTYVTGGGPITVRPSIEFQDKQGVSYPISFNTDSNEFSFDAAGNYGTGSIVGRKLTLSNVGGTALNATGSFAHAGDYLNTTMAANFRFDGNMTIGYDATRTLTVKSTTNFLSAVSFLSPVTFGDGNDTITINPGASNALNITSANLTSNANGTTIAGNLTVNGNLNIIGNASTIHSTNVQIGDNIIVLNADMPGGMDPVLDAGFQVARGTAQSVKWVWDETNDYFSPVGQSIGNVNNLTATTLNGTLTGNVTGNVTGSVSGNAGSATKLTTARTIAGVAFDGTQNISLTTATITEDTNLYFTTARARAAISVSGSLVYNSTTGVIAYTAPTLATVATTGSYNDLLNKPSIPTKTSDLTNDAGYVTSAALIPAFYSATNANTPLLVTAMSITYADTTVGAVNVMLPASPVPGTLVQVRWDAGANTLTVSRNGKTIESLAQDMVFDSVQQQGNVYGFRYTGATWRVE